MTQGIRAVLDTDTYNEIDDQFAVVYALLSPEIRLEALYAAPFHNERSSGPADGMRKSYQEIQRLLERLPEHRDVPVHEGCTERLPAGLSAASRDLIERAGSGDGPLQVLAIGPATNVAAALLAEPGIAEHITVVWIGGNPRHWHGAVEFNVGQDVAAARVLLDSGVPLVHVPCRAVAEQLRTTRPEIEAYVRGAGPIGDYLAGIFDAYRTDHFGRSKVLWDLAAVAWLVNPAWVPTVTVHSPVLTDQGTWSHDPRRHLIREAWWADRDAIFADLFRKLRQRPPR